MIRRTLALAFALALLLLCAAPALAEYSTENTTIMYVYTDNRKSLNVRSAPYVGNNIIAAAYFGTALNVKRFLDNGWACIQWNASVEAYVQTRYLRWDRPDSNTAAPATPVVTAAPTAVPYSYPSSGGNSGYAGAYTDSLITLNAEFRTARLVSPFIVVVRPARASGWVNMRWAPSKDAEVLSTYRSGAKLTVIAESQSWYQVADPDTEATGFIMKSYAIRQN